MLPKNGEFLDNTELFDDEFLDKRVSDNSNSASLLQLSGTLSLSGAVSKIREDSLANSFALQTINTTAKIIRNRINVVTAPTIHPSRSSSTKNH